MFHWIGEQMPNECNVSHAEDFVVSGNSECRSQLGRKLAQAEGRERRCSVARRLDTVHSCTFLTFVTELVCALDHSSNAFALDQDFYKK